MRQKCTFTTAAACTAALLVPISAVDASQATSRLNTKFNGEISETLSLASGDNRIDTISALPGELFSSGGVAGGVAAASQCGAVVSQNTDQDTIEASALACGTATSTAENGWARMFPAGQLTSICGVRFGVAFNTGIDWDVTVNIYSGTIPGSPDSLTLLGSSTVMVPAGAAAEFMTAPFCPPIQPPSGQPVVVEVFSPDKGAFSFRLGMNSNGQSAPSFLRSDTCGLPNFTNAADIGFPELAFLILPRNGEALGACCNGSSCDVTTEAACTGTFTACGIDCDWPGVCTADPAGACCDPTDGSCELVGASACVGDFAGQYVSCGEANCQLDSDFSCDGWCFDAAPGGCFCDDGCFDAGDCCSDVCDHCELEGCPDLNSCGETGSCGGQAPGGCWCDEACCGLGDCCEDKFAECGGCDPDGAASCEGICGSPDPAPSGTCFCDEACCDFGDCCPDKWHECGGCVAYPTGEAVVCPSGALLESQDFGAANSECGENNNSGCIDDGPLSDLGTLTPGSPAPDCPADITGTGTVNVFDLLELLGNWGTCADCGNCPADLTGNCTVNVFDLLELLGNWGPCPTNGGNGGPGGVSVCGTWHINNDGETATRDLDWYKFTLAEEALVEVCLNAESLGIVGIIDTGGVDACPTELAFIDAWLLGPNVDDTCATAVLGAGTWYVLAYPPFFGVEVAPPAFLANNLPCGLDVGNNYVLTVNVYDLAFSCAGNCFDIAPGGCFCDETCFDAGDCCIDVCQQCELFACVSCAGNCGGASHDFSCFCDEACFAFEDCCVDVCDECSDLCNCDPNCDPLSCEGSCGGVAPGLTCACDEACFFFEDCCADVCDHCEAEVPGCTGSCAGSCGGQDASGCWCDDLCFGAGDCCPDVCIECPELGGC